MCTPNSERTFFSWIKLGLVFCIALGLLAIGCNLPGQFIAFLPAATSTPTPTATPQPCVHSSPIAPMNWSVVLCDTFSDNQNKWRFGELSNSYVKGNRSISDGRYKWDLKSRMDSLWYEIPRGDSVGDFYLTIEGQREEGQGEAAYGMIFHYDGLSLYAFAIRNDGVFFVDLNYQLTLRA